MGIFDLLSKEGRAKSALQSAIKSLTEKWTQTDVRQGAIDKLARMDTPEALDGLMKRFTFVCDNQQNDVTEKQMVENILIGLGDRAIPPVHKYILSGESISRALTVLGSVAKPDKVLAIIDELCEREEPGYTRHPEKKIQFITWLADYHGAPSEEVARRIVPYVKDFDEGVRFAAIEALSHQKPAEADARGPLLDALIRPEEESRRIKVRIAEVFSDLEWRVDDTPEHKEAVVKMLNGTLSEFGLSHEKIQRPATGKSSK